MSESKPGVPKVPDEGFRRRYVRVDVTLPVTYSRENDDGPRTGSTRDLGGGGLRLATDEDLPLGTLLLLRLTLPERTRETVARGRIVLSFYNAQDACFFHGIAFTQIDPREQEEIARYVVSEALRQASPDDSGS